MPQDIGHVCIPESQELVGPTRHPARVSNLLRDRAALWLLVVALVLRLALLVASDRFDLKIQDERHYHEIAANLLHDRTFAVDGHPTSLRPPLYPALIALIWAAVGEQSLTAVRLVQIAISLLNCVLLYQLGLQLFNRRVARLALAGRAFYPSLLFADMLLLTEVLFTFLLTAVPVGFVALLRQRRTLMALATGVCLGLAALTRSVLWPFPLVLVPLTVWWIPGSLGRKTALAGLLLAGYAMVISPWAIRNTRLQGTLTIVDTMGGLNLLMGNYAHTPDDRMWAAVGLAGEKGWSYALQMEHPDAGGWSEGRKEKWAQRKAIEFMWQNPWLSVRRAAIKFSDFWGLEREFAAGIQRQWYELPRWMAGLWIAAIAISYPLVMLLAVPGMFLAGPTDRRVHAFLLLIVLFICGIHTVVFGHSRYHLPLVPLLLLYAASAADALGARTLQLRATTLLPAAATVALLIAIWAHQLFFVDAERLRLLLDVLT